MENPWNRPSRPAVNHIREVAPWLEALLVVAVPNLLL